MTQVTRDFAIELRTKKVEVSSFYDESTGKHGFVYTTGYNGSSQEIARSREASFSSEEEATQEGGIVLKFIRGSDLSQLWNR